MTETSSTGFVIEHFNLEQNTITVRPYSPKFKNQIESYPCFNITITNLDPLQSFEEQIAMLTKPIVENILKQESTESKEKVKVFLENNKNNLILIGNDKLMNANKLNEHIESMQQTGILEVIT
jgi:hypothetical protein